jgi:DNA-binding transcriptional MerR regulator
MSKVRPTTTIADWHSAKAAARISGLSADMVNYLCRYKIVVPSGNKRRGPGIERKYTYSDVLLLRAIAKMLSQGISVLRLKKSLAAFQRRGGTATDIAKRKYFLTDGYNVYFADSAALELLDSGQMMFAFVLELGSLRNEIDAKIARTRKAA